MIVGAHESVAGGLDTAFSRATVDGCRALQIFTKNSNAWREPAIDDAKREAFRLAHANAGALPVLSHASYLVNLAAEKADVAAKSRDSLAQELARSSALGVAFVVVHPGAHLGAGTALGVARIAEAIDEIHARVPDATARLLLENTAGQGTCLGHRFDELAAILAAAKSRARLGVCFDTQHAFAAGYDLRSEEGYEAAFAEFDEVVGLAQLFAFHLNDSKKPLGSRVDRHEHLGEGALGLEPFRRLLHDARFAAHPAVLETEPREGDAPFRDEVALLLRLAAAEQR